MLFFPCKHRRTLERDLSQAEVTTAHREGLDWVTPTTKLFAWHRGKFDKEQQKVFFVEDRQLFCRGVINRAADTSKTGGQLAHSLWGNASVCACWCCLRLSRCAAVQNY